MNIYDFRIHQSIYCKIILTFCWIKFSNISEEIFWRLLMFYQKETWAKGRNWGVKMRRIVTNEVTTSQGFDARRRNEGMVGIGFQRGSLSGSGGHLGVGKYDWQADRTRRREEQLEKMTVNMKIRTAERRMTVNTSPWQKYNYCVIIIMIINHSLSLNYQILWTELAWKAWGRQF